MLAEQLAAARQADDDIITEAEIAALLRHYASGDIEDKVYQETLIDAFLVRAYVYEDHYRIFFTTDPDRPVKFDIDLTEGSHNDLTLRPVIVMRTLGIEIAYAMGLYRFIFPKNSTH